MKQKKILGIFALVMVVFVGIGMVSAFGFGKGYGPNSPLLNEEEKAQLAEQQKEIQTAIEKGDFAAWKSLMEKRIEKMKQQITEENFNILKEKHQKMTEFRNEMLKARESGDFSKIAELKEKYGVGKTRQFKGICPNL